MSRLPSPRSLSLAGLLLASAAACAGPPPEVIVDTRVAGEVPPAKQAEFDAWVADASRASARAWHRIRPKQLRVEAPPPTQSEPAPAAPAAPAAVDTDDAALFYEPVPPQDRAAFDALVLALREGPSDEVGVVARNLAEAAPALWPAIATLLAAERERPKREYKQVLGLIGGDVPNRYGHFALHWKKAHGHQVKLSEDWFEDLLALAPGRISKLLRPVYRDAILSAALLQAAPRIAARNPALVDEIVTTLLDVAYVHEGTFRDEVGRAIDGLGDPAIAALLRESHVPEQAKEGSVPERRAAYARFSLDRMDRLHPSRALEAVASDRRRLAEVIEAYGIVREGEAAPLLLDYADSDAPIVREHARIAFDAYVSGPLPKVRRKSIRLLNGETSTQRAQLSYRTHARLAIHARLSEVAPDLLEEECKLWVEGVIDTACERQPERLYDSYIGLLDARREARHHELVARALSHEDPVAGATMLDALLTDTSAALDAKLVAPFFVDVAKTVADRGDVPRSAQLLRKSAMLLATSQPRASRNLTVHALLLEAQAEGIDARGRKMLLTTARELNPESEPVHAAIAAVEERSQGSTDAERERLASILLIMLASLGLVAWASSALHQRLASRAQPLEA